MTIYATGMMMTNGHT